MDFLAQHGETGIVKTIPEGIPPGSDSANLSVLGYDPHKYYTGRSPLEAVSMGVELSDRDIAIRCNLVTLSEENDYLQKIMIDYCSDEISSVEASELIGVINHHFKTAEIEFHAGLSYRHCMVWRNGSLGHNLTPPHDIIGQRIQKYLPNSENSRLLLEIMKQSHVVLKDHPINRSRVARGLNPANSVWFWGEGKKPSLSSFYDKHGLRGSVIATVDLIKGIGICTGLKPVDLKDSKDNIHNNYTIKAQAALWELEAGQDFVYLHVEDPDECSHRYEIENKVKSIEYLDDKIVSVILRGIEKYDDYKILILPDHATPLSLRTHTKDPVPYILYQKSRHKLSKIKGFDEFQAMESNIFIEEGHKLMDWFLNGKEIKDCSNQLVSLIL
jgi:2,3-bisphosphoglycerate-independent phosphoglycerate mutase